MIQLLLPSVRQISMFAPCQVYTLCAYHCLRPSQLASAPGSVRLINTKMGRNAPAVVQPIVALQLHTDSIPPSPPRTAKLCQFSFEHFPTKRWTLLKVKNNRSRPHPMTIQFTMQMTITSKLVFSIIPHCSINYWSTTIRTPSYGDIVPSWGRTLQLSTVWDLGQPWWMSGVGNPHSSDLPFAHLTLYNPKHGKFIKHHQKLSVTPMVCL